MASRLISLALVTSLAACGGDDTSTSPDAAPLPDAGVAIGACRDFVATGAFRASNAPALWHVVAGVPTQLLAEPVRGFAVSPDRARIAIPRPFAVHVIDLASGARSIVALDGTPTEIEWTRRDPIAVAETGVWAIDTGSAQARLLLAGTWTDARLSPDGLHLAAVGSEGASVLILATGDRSPLAAMPLVTRVVGWSGSDTVLTVGGGAGHQALARVRLDGGGSTHVTGLNEATEFALSPDGRRLATLSPSGTDRFLHVIDLEATEQSVFFDLADKLELLSWASDDALLYYRRSDIANTDELNLGEVVDPPSPSHPRLVTGGAWQEAFALGACNAPPF
jgi:hypothetical protein